MASLDRECRVFATYLTGREPREYVLASYRAAHERGELARLPAPDGFERALVRLATFRPTTRIVDVYTALFMKRAVVRKKLVLVLAILESSAPAFEYFEGPDHPGVPRAVVRLTARGLASAVALLAALIFLGPPHLAAAAAARLQGSR
jgi:hypothetical protein